MKTDPGTAVLAAWGAAVLTVLEMVRRGESTAQLESSARFAIAVATGKRP